MSTAVWPVGAALGALALLALAPGAGAESVTVETARGSVTVEAEPERVVALDIAAIDTLDALGVALIGRPSRLYLGFLSERVAAAEPVGTLFEPDYEALASLAPDLIVAGGRSSGEVDGLAEIAPTLDMTIWGADVVAQSLARIRDYGRLFAREAEAARLAADIEAAIARARASAEGQGTVLLLMSSGPKISVYGPASRFGWIYTALGLTPAAADLDASNHGQVISYEFVHAADPDWIMVIDRSAAIGERVSGAGQTLDNAVVADTEAWRAGRVIQLDPASVYIASGGARAMVRVFAEIADAFDAAR